MGLRQILFSVNTNDSKLVRNLSQIKDEYDDYALRSASIATGLTDSLLQLLLPSYHL